MTTVQITQVTPDLEEFMEECNKRRYLNNRSLKTMKFNWCLESGGKWFGSYDNNKLVGISGVHPFKDGWRALFRGCQLYSIPGGLSKLHMNCWMFRDHLPLVISSVNDDPIYITTHVEDDSSGGKMLMVNQLYEKHLSKHNIVEHVGVEKVFNIKQNVWKLNPEQYTTARDRLVS